MVVTLLMTALGIVGGGYMLITLVLWLVTGEIPFWLAPGPGRLPQ
ncbi:hypothetical protein [Microbacterium oxydans]|nr:hypothetical protein [Microbacterium oxydans]